MASVNLEHIAAGGNRHPSAADWAPRLLAFATGNNIALWDPDEKASRGIVGLLTGHTDVVNVVKIFHQPHQRYIISGSSDKSIRIWTRSTNGNGFAETQCLNEHKAAINTISILPSSHLVVTGSADGVLNVWNLSSSAARLVQSISLKPHYLPLTSALIELKGGAVVLAVSGTSMSIHLYVSASAHEGFERQATLLGHEGWIRSLDFVRMDKDVSSDIILASASQDKYIRLWRIHMSSTPTFNISTNSTVQSLAAPRKSLASKTQQIKTSKEKYSVTFEALLIGHEDWIYTVRWAPRHEQGTQLQLLSASADNSLAIWQKDESSGIWVCDTRLGEISAQKGSTTATGSTGGFWIGLWSPAGQSVVSLGRTGSWRKWQYEEASDTWQQQPGISGHTQEVRGLAWTSDGSYIISTSSDQTTRLFAEWKRNDQHSWHELARPQIHGYDLNCIDTLGQNQFISGADEKLLRVFNKPRAIANLMVQLCGTSESVNGVLPDAASIPVLGLSNKAIAMTLEEDTSALGSEVADVHENGDFDSTSLIAKSTLDIDHPPFEEHLSRQTLWPEHEKLYGHGYEISAVAASHDGSLVATACKASSLEHAVIRVYECRDWREVKPPLTAHNLTVTSLAFSPDDRILLSVGRDRQWAMFARESAEVNTFELLMSNPKGHARMILDCSWAPSVTEYIFATAGRDKTVKIWKRTATKTVDCVNSMTADASVTAVAFRKATRQGLFRLALGTENGMLQLVDLHSESLEVAAKHEVPRELMPSGTINALRWRPNQSDHGDNSDQLAVASNDLSLRIFNIGP